MNSKVYPLIQLLFVLIITNAYSSAFADDTYSVENPLEHQTNIPKSILSDLSKKIDLQQYGCLENEISETLEASAINLNSSFNHILVKPKAWCLCGANYCPVWIYQLNKKNTRLIWSSPGTSYVEILDKKNRRYKQIRDGGGTAGHEHQTTWVWDGKKYSQTGANHN